jgi:hypothetical protein
MAGNTKTAKASEKKEKDAQAVQPAIERRYDGDEAMRWLGCTHRLTLWRWRRRGLLGYYRIGNRIEYGEHHLREFLARCERKAKGVKEAA